GELDHVGATDEDRAGRAETRHGGGILLRMLDHKAGASTRVIAGDIEEVLERDRQPIDCRAAHACLPQPVGVVGFRARAFRVNLQKSARAFAGGIGDARERLFDKLAAGGAAGGEIGRELRYSPHGEKMLCEKSWGAYFSAAAATCAAAAPPACFVPIATRTCRGCRP